MPFAFASRRANGEAKTRPPRSAPPERSCPLPRAGPCASPAGSRAEALQVARALSERGISDYYVITAGPQQDSISLGLFRDLANATQRREAVAALGYSPIMEPRTEPVSQWWIDLAAAPGFDWKSVVAEDGLRAEPAACR